MPKKFKTKPKFKNKQAEYEFFEKLDITKCFKLSDAKRPLFPNLKLTTRSISLRLPEYIISRVKMRANSLDVPYQALMKEYIAKGILLEQK